MSIFLGYGFALLTATLAIFGDYYLKLAADGRQTVISVNFLVGAAFYVGSAAMWYFSMRQITLAQAGVAYSALTLLALCALGAISFGEVIQTREVLGIGCAIAAMILMIRIT